MSNLYGSISGERGEVTKCGSKNLSAHIRGWNLGILIEAHHCEDGDTFRVYKTTGSNGSPSDNELIINIQKKN